jgi:hypothetical protein
VDVGTSSLHLAVIIAMIAAGVAALVLLLRALTGQRQRDLAAQRPVRDRVEEQPRPPAVPPTRFFDAPLPDPSTAPARRPAAAGHHPAPVPVSSAP